MNEGLLSSMQFERDNAGAVYIRDVDIVNTTSVNNLRAHRLETF